MVEGMVSGAFAGIVWGVFNLLYDFVFIEQVRKHQDRLRPFLMSRPGLNLAVLFLVVMFWGAIFGMFYSIVQSALPGSSVIKGLIYGLLLTLSFGRGCVEGIIWTKDSISMNLFWLGEAIIGLLAYGSVLAYIYSDII